jgi:acyl-CoA reductase-like NAD-dependent aldehyde dehydrogenase
MIAFPDSEGWMTVACRARSGRPDAACASVAGTLRSRSGRPVPLGPDAHVSKTLDGATRAANRARLAAAAGLRSRSAATRARSFRRLAAANMSAARTLAKLRLRPQEPVLFDDLVTALRAEAAILRRLGRAARGNRRGPYDEARGALRTAERRVDGAERNLRAAGYTGG